MNKTQPFCKRKQTTSLIAIAAILIGFAIIFPKLLSLKKDTEPIEMGQMIKHDLITVDSPQMMEKVDGEIMLRGEARGYWFFEGSFPLELVDEAGNKLIESYATAQSEWMTEEFVPFEAKLEFESPGKGLGTLILHRDNPSGLPENDDSIGIPVIFEGK